MVSILNIFFIAIGLSMDAFALSLGYGICNDTKTISMLPFFVCLFHFFMPLIGNKVGGIIIKNSIFDSRYILFIILLLLAFDMLISFFDKNNNKKELNLYSVILLSLSVSLDSFTVGFGIDFLCNNIFAAVSIISFASFLFTTVGIILGKLLSKKLHKYSYLIGFLILSIYSFIVLTK